MFVLDFKPLDFDTVDITALFTLLDYEIVSNDVFNNDCGLINQIELLFNLNFDLIDNNGTNKTVIDLIELFNSEKAFYKAFELIVIQMTYNHFNNVLKTAFSEIKDDLEEFGYLSDYYNDILDLTGKDYNSMSTKEKNGSIMAYIKNRLQLDCLVDYDFIQLLQIGIKFI